MNRRTEGGNGESTAEASMTLGQPDKRPAPARGRARLKRRARLELDLWRHRMRHPLTTLRTLAARRIPYRWRARVLQALGRRRGVSTTAPQPLAGASGWSSVSRTSARPVILCLPLIAWSFRRQRPQHLLEAMTRRGWSVIYADPEPRTGEMDIAIDGDPAPGVRTIRLPSTKGWNPTADRMTPADVALLEEAFEDLRRRARIHRAVVLVQAPFWASLAARLQQRLGWPLVYDRMDRHAAFSTAGPRVGQEERRLMAEARLITASASSLAECGEGGNGRTLLLPNACTPSIWVDVEPSPELEEVPPPRIGYMGAVADWVDTGLLLDLALEHPDWSLVLIGSTWGSDVARLERLSNVHVLGEREHEELPGLVAGLDVGVIPFKSSPLTEAADPVKVYEMLAMGLEVVATPLPELEKLGSLIRRARDPEEFVREIDEALRHPADPDTVWQRRRFARSNTWDDRAAELDEAVRGLFPRVSIGIVAHNNLELTRMCLDSVRRCTVYPNYEVWVLDNGSSDETRSWLNRRAEARPELRVLVNNHNAGFAAGNNRVFAEAEGEVFCLLNNDTLVTRGWLSTMVDELMRDPGIGLVGPSTNGAANAARVRPGYADLGQLDQWAESFTWRHEGESFALPVLALHCAVLRREVWEAAGGLDERFEVGMFEDDDLSRRLRTMGYEIRCLRGAWVHHFQQASFAALDEEEYGRVYEANRKRFTRKWSRTAGDGAAGKSR